MTLEIYVYIFLEIYLNTLYQAQKKVKVSIHSSFSFKIKVIYNSHFRTYQGEVNEINTTGKRFLLTKTKCPTSIHAKKQEIKKL